MAIGTMEGFFNDNYEGIVKIVGNPFLATREGAEVGDLALVIDADMEDQDGEYKNGDILKIESIDEDGDFYMEGVSIYVDQAEVTILKPLSIGSKFFAIGFERADVITEEEANELTEAGMEDNTGSVDNPIEALIKKLDSMLEGEVVDEDEEPKAFDCENCEANGDCPIQDLNDSIMN